MLDDFGTGYSSLAYLTRLPLDALKVDRSFVDGLGTERRDTAITEAIVAMSHALSLEVIAEGVETALQANELVRLGCDFAQGFYFSRPVPRRGDHDDARAAGPRGSARADRRSPLRRTRAERSTRRDASARVPAYSVARRTAGASP